VIEVRSWAVGTAGLWIAVIAAALLTVRRPIPALSDRDRHHLVLLGLLAIAVQVAHFGEELSTGFFTAFPQALGLSPWSRRAFIVFNVAWLGVWLISLPAAARGNRIAQWPLWFLAIALVLNGIAHPVLAVLARGYFPGLVTSVAAFLAGGVMLKWMLRVSGCPPEPAPAAGLGGSGG
jgi:hypothetical protein